MLEIMMERLLFTMPAGKHTLIIGCYGTWFVCVCILFSYHAPITQQDVLSRSADHRIFKFGI